MATSKAPPDTPATEMIPVASIVKIRGVQPREKLDKHHIESLAATGPDTWPPIKVIPRPNNRYGLIAGEHRWEAAKRLNLESIAAIILPPIDELGLARIEAIEDNIRNGLPLSAKVRRELIGLLKQRYPNIPNTEIARRAGVTEGTVRYVLKRQRREEGEESEEERYSVAQETPAARKLLTAARAFYKSEASGFLGMAGSNTPAAAQMRLKALVKEARKQDVQEVVTLCQSLIETLTAVVRTLKPVQK